MLLASLYAVSIRRAGAELTFADLLTRREIARWGLGGRSARDCRSGEQGSAELDIVSARSIATTRVKTDRRQYDIATRGDGNYCAAVGDGRGHCRICT